MASEADQVRRHVEADRDWAGTGRGRAGGKSTAELVRSIVAHSSARVTCFPHFLDQPREVSLGPLLQFIYRVVAVVDADLF
jgi:hypothetical protein